MTKETNIDSGEGLDLSWWRSGAEAGEYGYAVTDPDTGASASLLCAYHEGELDGGEQRLTRAQTAQVEAWFDDYEASGVEWDKQDQSA